LIRGDRLKPGAAVPRRLPQVLAALDDGTFSDDGRLALATGVASRENPLTARVLVNRVWQQHFGSGARRHAGQLRRHRGAPLAPGAARSPRRLVHRHGWSLKALHRYIMTSATWQQSSAGRVDALERDPSNRLLWRMSPRRLEFEALRDSLLRVSGRLDVKLGGRSAPLDDENVRRAVYGSTDRFRIPPCCAISTSPIPTNPSRAAARPRTRCRHSTS
jgi:hypothetical protein